MLYDSECHQRWIPRDSDTSAWKGGSWTWGHLCYTVLHDPCHRASHYSYGVNLLYHSKNNPSHKVMCPIRREETTLTTEGFITRNRNTQYNIENTDEGDEIPRRRKMNVHIVVVVRSKRREMSSAPAGTTQHPRNEQAQNQAATV